MRRTSIAAIILGSLGLCGLHQAAHAHDAWLAKVHGEYHVMWGHDSSRSDPYKPGDITEARAIKNGVSTPLNIMRADKFVRMDAGDANVVSATMLNGFRARTADGKYHGLSKDEAAKLGEVQSSAYRTRYMVVYANDREEPKPLGYELELIPQFNPSKAKKGGIVPVQVLYKGKPLANATISDNILSRHSHKIQTDAQGRANLSVANDGHNAWSVRHSVPYHDLQKADTYSYSSVVTFFAASQGGHGH
ncbi:MAG: DUF4198 domain-containing protein [Brachymonas sp.]|nr:DUF4198 domain-containing protein [Brachymonas sp.]